MGKKRKRLIQLMINTCTHMTHTNVRREEKLLAVFLIIIIKKEFKYGTDLKPVFTGIVKDSLKLYFPLFFLAISENFSL